MNLSINIQSRQNRYSTSNRLSTELYDMLYGKLYKLKLSKFSLTWTAGATFLNGTPGSEYSVSIIIKDPAASLAETKVFVSSPGKITAGQAWAQSFSGGETTLLPVMGSFHNGYEIDYNPVLVTINTPDYYNNSGGAPIFVKLTGTIPIDVWYADC